MSATFPAGGGPFAARTVSGRSLAFLAAMALVFITLRPFESLSQEDVVDIMLNLKLVAVRMHAREETEQKFAALVEGGKVLMPLTKTFWSPMYGMLVDKFGVHWMVMADDRSRRQS